MYIIVAMRLSKFIKETTEDLLLLLLQLLLLLPPQIITQLHVYSHVASCLER